VKEKEKERGKDRRGRADSHRDIEFVALSRELQLHLFVREARALEEVEQVSSVLSSGLGTEHRARRLQRLGREKKMATREDNRRTKQKTQKATEGTEKEGRR